MKRLLNHFSGLRSRSSYDEQARKYKINFLNHVFLFAGVVAFGMGFVRWQQSILMGMLDFIFSGLAFSLLIYLRKHHEKVAVLSSIALGASYILFFAIFVLVPHNATRSSLLFLLSASAFFLKGRKIGFIWMIFIIASVISAYLIFDSKLAFSHVDILTLVLYLIALFFIFDSYEHVKEDQRLNLENLNLHLEDQIQHRTKELNDTVVALSNEIAERELADHQLRIAATVFESQEGMIVTDADRLIIKVNLALETISGYRFDALEGKNPRLLSAGTQSPAFYEAMWACINSTGFWTGEILNRRKNGEVYPGLLSITAVKNAAGVVTNYVGTLKDISVSKAASDKIHNLAYYDPLTQLPNRRLLIERLNHAFSSSNRSGRHGALLFMDLDNFKALNDTLGHEVGDLLLQQVAGRLITCVREGDTVSRLGGDEFVVLLEDLNEHAIDAAAQTQHVVDNILSVLNQPYQLNQHHYHGTPSIGIRLFKDHEAEVDELLKQADIAMYQSKKTGRNTAHFFDPVMQQVINRRVEIENELRKAIEQQQFQLYYQIQVGSNGQPIGAEALIRWQHPGRGMIPPFEFIPVAEETGLILQIGQWVLETACAQIKAWQQDPLLRDLTLAINVSAKQFHQSDFVEQVQASIVRHHINTTRLKLELTESMLVDNVQDMIVKMKALNKIGVHFSLDDFGTGYSSLQYLKMLPLNQLKIDRSFVRDIISDPNDRAIVRTIITMASHLDINVIAEGVESEEQRLYLLENGCEYFQGYLFGRPMPVDEFEATLRKDSGV